MRSNRARCWSLRPATSRGRKPTARARAVWKEPSARNAALQAAPPARARSRQSASRQRSRSCRVPASRARVEAPGSRRPSGCIRPSGRTLDEIRRELGDCKRCKLCNGPQEIVFGVGQPARRAGLRGRGPRAQKEDLQGVPFVGPAGQLLTKMIEAMGFSRDDVYICNVVKCRPPGNRNPEPDEIAACEPFLQRAAAGDPAQGDRRAGEVRGADAAARQTRRSPGCAASGASTRASS